MPVGPCQSNKKKGYKYGGGGKCYTGSGAKKKAAKQWQAIEISRHRKKKK